MGSLTVVDDEDEGIESVGVREKGSVWLVAFVEVGDEGGEGFRGAPLDIVAAVPVVGMRVGVATREFGGVIERRRS